MLKGEDDPPLLGCCWRCCSWSAVWAAVRSRAFIRSDNSGVIKDARLVLSLDWYNLRRDTEVAGMSSGFIVSCTAFHASWAACIRMRAIHGVIVNMKKIKRKKERNRIYTPFVIGYRPDCPRRVWRLQEWHSIEGVLPEEELCAKNHHLTLFYFFPQNVYPIAPQDTFQCPRLGRKWASSRGTLA